MGRLTTHVLDLASGRPAEGVRVRLRADGKAGVLADIVTNADGRSGAPLLEGESFKTGAYVLAFSVGDYFRASGVTLSDPPFFDIVDIGFSVSDANAHHHVPLLVSPYGYSTYRGS